MAALTVVGLLVVAIGGQAAGGLGLFLLVAAVAYGLRRPRLAQSVFEPRHLARGSLPGRETTWGQGARGEQITEQVLRHLEPLGYMVLNDRRLPGSRANIDHVVIGPTGVFVVETKRYQDDVWVSRCGELYVGGQWRADVIEQVHREAAIVADLIAPVPVMPIVCIHPAGFRPKGPHHLRGAWVTSRYDLEGLMLGAAGRLSPAQVWELADRIDQGLESALAAAPDA